MSVSQSLFRISDVWTLTVEARTETIFSNLPGPDKRWRFTDSAGHEHYYGSPAANPALGENPYPTLRWVTNSGHPDELEDEYYYWACIRCGETVTPGTVGPSNIGSTIETVRTFILVFDDGHERWEYLVMPDEMPNTMTASLVDWAEDLAATVEGHMVAQVGG